MIETFNFYLLERPNELINKNKLNFVLPIVSNNYLEIM